MSSLFTLTIVMLLFVIYTIVGGIFALYWAVKLIAELIVQMGKSVTDKLLPGWL